MKFTATIPANDFFAECTRDTATIRSITSFPEEQDKYDYFEVDADDINLLIWHSKNFDADLTFEQLESLKALTA